MTRFLRAPAVYNIPVPVPEPGELQIRVAYVALNPTDRMYRLLLPANNNEKNFKAIISPALIIIVYFSN